MDMFLFKKIVAAYVMPVPVTILLLMSGLLLLFFKRQKAGLICTTLATLLLVISTSTSAPSALLKPIEKAYPQFDMSRPVSHIVVLGCGHVNDATLPLTAQLHPCSLYRVAEAVRIFRNNPQATVIVSGGRFLQEFTTAEMHRRMLVALGVPDRSIVKLDDPHDTEQEVLAMAPMLKGKPFALVTSASHLPRAMGLFEEAQLAPTAAPAEYLVKESDSYGITSHAPSTNNIMKLERWWYETLSQTWLTIKSWFSE